MSGGSYNYVGGVILDLASELRNKDQDPRRAAFAKLLILVGMAMHDIEWVDSCDYAQGDEHLAVDKVFSFLEADPDTIKKARAFDALKSTLQEYFK